MGISPLLAYSPLLNCQDNVSLYVVRSYSRMHARVLFLSLLHTREHQAYDKVAFPTLPSTPFSTLRLSYHALFFVHADGQYPISLFSTYVALSTSRVVYL